MDRQTNGLKFHMSCFSCNTFKLNTTHTHARKGRIYDKMRSRHLKLNSIVNNIQYTECAYKN